MRWQEDVFGPLLTRTMENAQIRHLAERYDLSRDSRLAQEIVWYSNEVLDAEEKRRGVRRVRPGELLLRTSRGPLVLPLRTMEDVSRVVAGERWDMVRRDILERCAARYRELFPEASPQKVSHFLRCIWQGHCPPGPASSPLHGPRKERPWDAGEDARPLAELDAERARRWLDRDPPRPGHLPGTLHKVAHFLGTQAGVPPAVQEPMILDLMAIRARFCPRLTVLASGQMPLAAMHVQAGRSLWQPARYQPLAPVVLSLLTPDEVRTLRHRPPRNYEQFLDFHGRRMARALTGAYTQNGLLSYAEVQWIFLASTGTVSRAIDHYQRKHRIVLPCPGTVLDMGRMLTHKALIVRLHLQGLSVLEIARKTYHNPRSVDAYLKAFDAVLILHLYGLTPALMASVLGRSESLVQEYLDLIAAYLKDADTMREHLRRKGVTVPLQISNGG